MGDCISLNLDKVNVFVLAAIYDDIREHAKGYSIVSDHYKSELWEFEKALRLVGIDPDMLKGVDTSY